MNIIFDFNRTIFDPDTQELVPGAAELLRALAARSVTLCLLSRRELGREAIIMDAGLTSLFAECLFVENKEPAIRHLVEESGDAQRVYLVGDHLHDEIRLGNRHGAKTIWLRRGKFAELRPETDEDVPWRTVEHLSEVLALIS